MANYTIKPYNNIAQIGLDVFDSDYAVDPDGVTPDAIILRSYSLHNEQIQSSVRAIARAGAGVNNIPVQSMSDQGIIVFNTPGANANAVKEAVIAGILIAARNVVAAANYTKSIQNEDIKTQVENGKKQFAGQEIAGKTLGVIGLGAIGYKVANTAIALGMKVVGYDPMISDLARKELDPQVELIDDMVKIAAEIDYLTVHVPLFETTKGLISQQVLEVMPEGSVLLNFSRDEIVNENVVLQLLEAGKLKYYVSDFPNAITKDHPKVIGLPHLGASTAEAEDTCAVMAAQQLKNYLETGAIANSVNYPNIQPGPKTSDITRLILLHKNVPGVVAKVSNVVSQSGLNIRDMTNKSRGDYACTILDLELSKSGQQNISALFDQFLTFDEVIKVHSL